MMEMMNINNNLIWDDEKRTEILDLWKRAVVYFNGIYKLSKYFPENAKYELDSRVQLSSLDILNNLAKASQVANRIQFESFLNEAVISIQSSVASLYVASQWEYVTRDRYNQAYAEGKILVEAINNLIWNYTMESLSI